ncbi:membrane protein FAM174B-like [Copidosoma floridanum]|uniref:membrane protein FAM174B-like n=1 Tax=Copidosoma floridanum TaxID=29053 RepID=UPI0006C99E6C|nr:membrane protein FAM174B-like [Copidosoma floridanum]
MRSRKRLLLAVLVIVFQVLVCLAVEPLPAAGKSHVDDAKVPEADSPQIAQQQKDVVAADASGTVNITSKHAAEASAPDAAATVQPSVEHAAPMDTATLNVGAMKRAIIVTCGFSVLVMMYLAFRSLRVNKARPQMVRKYGILAHRQDVEMRPLPLDEDDEDDTTIFDASNISAKRLVT